MTSVRAAIPFARPKVWGWLFCAPFVIAAGLFAEHGRMLAAGASAVAAAAWMISAMIRPADRHRVAFVAGIGAVLALLTTWLSSTVVAFAVTGDRFDDRWVTIWLIAAPNIGGLLALFRSVQTRAETSATLRELSELRVAALSAPLTEASVGARESGNVAEVLQGLTRMLRLAVGLRLLPREIDRASIWVLNPLRDQWSIQASTTLRRFEPSAFRQDRLAAPVAGAGIVCNFATGGQPPSHPGTFIDGDVMLVRSQVEQHPWFKPNPEESRKSDGMAVALIRVENEVKAVLCLTSASEVIPVSGPQAREVVDILAMWSHTFSTVVEILYASEGSNGGEHDVELEQQ